ncbi:hypothetical protein GN958_ATG21240 [Phytophthora infestans]|uniref:Uncharacterized protein n=1 Tax=Phytophthora infestans TaxID=4787 RepID=A0A8S9TM91_PHYIN|nr:hypothetical protein GN958_ATG21240 [Phytophthora infestans]
MAEQDDRGNGESPYQLVQAQMSGKQKGRSTPFQDSHLLEFGPAVSERSPTSGFILAVACRFCMMFGREEEVDSKRKVIQTNKFYKRTDRNHLLFQHPSRWAQYEQLSSEAKRVFFDDVKPFRATIRSFASEKQAPIVVSIGTRIVDEIIEQILLDGDENNFSWERTKKAAFKRDDSGTHFVLIINNPLQFHLIVDYLSYGMSFRMALSVLTNAKQRTGLASIGSCSPDLPSKYARFVCAMSLQKIKLLLCAAWTFSVALDMSTHMSVSYLDTRIRLFHCGQIINLHLLAIPMYDSHTGEAMFNAIIPILDVLGPDWKEVMLGVTTDGERK